MTTIICIQKDDGVQFGADSQTTAPNGRVYSHDKMVKISQTGNYIIAGSGECAPCDIAQHIWQPPLASAKDLKDLYHFMIAKVIPSMKQCFKDNDYKLEDDSDETRFSFLIAINGTVFEVADDFSVALNRSGFYGVGSGSSYAIGALHAGATPALAMKIAAENDAYTSAPFIWKSQKKN